jgi:uncharacterized protein (TIGR02246 family)
VDEDVPFGYPEWTAGDVVLADQSSVEPILIDAARQRGAEHRFNTRLVSFDVDADGVTALLEDGASGDSYRVCADYLVGADGNRSAIRAQLGIARRGPGVTRHFVSILFDADLSGVVQKRALFWIIRNPNLPASGASFGTTAVPNRWAAAVFHDADADAYDPARDAPETYSRERCVDLVRTIVGDQRAIEVVDVAGWEEAVGVADTFHAGRIFLVGDSAHVWPPAGAMGANSAVQDAHNLAWKLAALVAGQAGPSLLESYDAERRPVALALADLTVRRQQARFGRGSDLDDVDDLLCILGQRYESTAVLDPEPGGAFATTMTPEARTGMRAPHLWLERDGARIASHDMFGTVWVLLTDVAGGAWCEAAARLARCTGVPLQAYRIGAASDPVDLVDLDRTWPRCGLPEGGALLIRPDGYVAWRGVGATGCAQALEDALGRVLGMPLRSHTSTGSEDAIRDLHARIDAAWNAGDAPAFASLWTSDGTLSNPMGQLSVGRDAIERDVQAELAYLKGSRHELAVARVHRPTSGVAVVDGEAALSPSVGPDGESAGPWTSQFTSVCVETSENQWRVADLRSYVSMQPESPQETESGSAPA